jgi:hypothetical protein
MRKGLISVFVLTVAFLSMVDEGGAVQVCLRMSCNGMPTLVPTLGAHVSPAKLPANEYVPATWEIIGKVATSDGTHPSALRDIHLDVDKDVRIDAGDLPLCRRRRIEMSTSKVAARACAKALVGRGEATVEVAFPEREPRQLSSPLLVFNAGERAGVTKLLIHAFIPIPVPTAILTVVTISKHGSGLQTISKIPVIAAGSGSLLDFKFTIGKTYAYKDRDVGYFEAKCPDGVFKANVRKLLFKNETKTPGEAASTSMKGSLAVPCTTRG